MKTARRLQQLRDCDPHRICMIKPSAFGDVVQSLPLLPMLRDRFPRAEISWVILRGLTPLLEGHPCLAETIPFDRHGGWTGWKRLLGTIRKRRFDVVIDLQGLLRTGLMTFASGARLRVGLETAREGSGFSCNLILPETGKQVAAYDRYWRLAELLGMQAFPRTTLVQTSGNDRKTVQTLIEDLPRPLLGIHPGARWDTKRWPAEKFREIAYRFSQQFNGSTVIVGSPDELPLGESIVSGSQSNTPARIRNLIGQTTLKQLADLLGNVDLMLSNDSGPMHLAAGLGTPVIGIFTCTSPQRSGPVGVGHECVVSQLSCAGSYKKVCPHSGTDHMACLRELDTERVWSAIQRQLQKQTPQTRTG